LIEIQDWQTQTASDIDLHSVAQRYALTFTCSESYDERGDWVDKFIQKISKSVKLVSYCPDEVSLTIDGLAFGIKNLDSYVIPEGRCLIDATSLALPELIHLFSIFNKQCRGFDVLYVQPNRYNEKKEKDIDTITSFDLSEDGLGIQQLPPYIGFSSKSTMLIFLGFEGHRVGSLLYSDEFRPVNATCLIGIPAFKIGWESKTLSNNYKQIYELRNNLDGSFKFAGANDPLKTYEEISLVYSSLKYQRKNLCLAPFGTKPAAIAAAQFAINNEGIIVTYDFVKKKKRRSDGADIVHTWSFEHLA
jgi:hypothetical protein